MSVNVRRPSTPAAIFLIVLGCARIAATYTVFSDTCDEGMHVTTGLQVLTERAYTLHRVNPPLPRVLSAIGPALAGARYDAGQDAIAQAVVKFHSTGHYKTLLVLARAGTLVFFILAAVATWAWARRELGEAGALFALFFFTTQPSILGHAGLATLDVAGTAGLALCMLAFSRWLDIPSRSRAIILGAAYGFAIACKFLCLVYVPLACAAIGVVRLLFDADARRRWRGAVTIALVLPVAALVLWAGYGFSVGPAAELAPIAQTFPGTWIAHVVTRLGASTPVPAPAFFLGLSEVVDGNRQGVTGYALGQISPAGWWWYFPLALALKTTLATLLAIAIGLVAGWPRRVLEPLAAALAILALSMTTHVDIGVRYILPIYVPLSLAAAAALLALWRSRSRIAHGTAIALVTWQSIASLVAHPDYLAYFNEIAARDPSYYLVDSNLDWGQDVLRLRDVVRRQKIAALGYSLVGPANLDLLGFPPHSQVEAFTPTHGWIAVSESSYRMTRTFGGWRWLVRRPYQRVGKSIRLYRIDD
jgi:4-amino-4-deoxy-L-arabinose transferase-like glycosyltransferase